MKRLCTICARGGSKGVANKNIMLLGGIPLIVHSILQAKTCALFEEVAVSSDSLDILDVGRNNGVDRLIKRPTELASDTAAKVPAIRHAVLAAEAAAGQIYDVIVDLDATSPLGSPQDIVNAVSLLEKTGCQSVITGSPAHRSPYFNLVERRTDGTVAVSKSADPPIVRRQDAPECFDMNASIYVWRRDALISDPKVFYDDTRLFEMPVERSRDIDSYVDFEYVEFLLNRGR